MEMNQSSRKLDDLTLDLLKEGILEGQFKTIQLLLSPQTLLDILSDYITHTGKIIDDLHCDLDPKKLDFDKAFEGASRLKGSSLSIGAERARQCCEAVMSNCKDKNLQGCLLYSKQLKQEYSLLKSKLEPVLSILQEIVALDDIAQMESED